MSYRRMLAAVPVLALAMVLPVAGPARAAAAPDDFRAVVEASVGHEWSVRFVDRTGTVLATVDEHALELRTRHGRVALDRVVAVHGHVVELGSAAGRFAATVRVDHEAEGVYGVHFVAHGGPVAAVSIGLRAPDGERYLGLGERSDAVDHRGLTVQNRVLDGPYTPAQQQIISGILPPPGYSPRTDATYFPVPWVLSTAGYGVLVDNDEDSLFRLATPSNPDVSRLLVKSDHLDLRVFQGPTPALALERMTHAVGRQPAASSPALYGAWLQALGDAPTYLAAQRADDVPISVMQTYTHYLPCGSQNTEREQALIAALHAGGTAVTTYFNPMVCLKYHPVYDEGLDAGAYTRNLDGTTLVYPYSTATKFDVSQIDFSGPAGRAFFEDRLQEAVDDGYDGWMEDFGEYTPAKVLSADGTPGPTMHNRYVEQYHATARHFEEQAPRPLLRFNRSGWTDAIPASSIVWGGDPTSDWGFDGLTSSVRQGLTMGTSGVSIWGPDIGGFFTMPGDPAPTTELLNRWIEFGAFTGVMRNEADGIHIGVDNPHLTDPDVAPIWKRYTRLRTMLYPYVAGSQDAYQRHGMPLMRHLALVHPGDSRAVASDDEYLFGQNLLVAPITEPGVVSRKVYLPRGSWLELARTWDLGGDGSFELTRARAVRGQQTVRASAPIDVIPLFLRAGGVVPMVPDSVDTLSTYGEGVEHLADHEGARVLLAAPAAGVSPGTLGAGERLTSTVTGHRWTLRLHATRDRAYDVRATLAALDSTWTPCQVSADDVVVAFDYDPRTRALTFSAPVGKDAMVRVTACR